MLCHSPCQAWCRRLATHLSRPNPALNALFTPPCTHISCVWPCLSAALAASHGCRLSEMSQARSAIADDSGEAEQSNDATFAAPTLSSARSHPHGASSAVTAADAPLDVRVVIERASKADTFGFGVGTNADGELVVSAVRHDVVSEAKCTQHQHQHSQQHMIQHGEHAHNRHRGHPKHRHASNTCGY